MKDAYYFSHDSNARNDKKILEMRAVYGSEGYGWFWMLVEMLREESDYRLHMQSKYVWNAFAMQLQCNADAAHKFVDDCINEFHLFDSDGVYFWSNSLIRRMERKDEKSEKARQAALSRWGKQDDANAMQMQSERNAIKEKKVKEKKVKEIKEVYRTIQHLTLTVDEYNKLRESFSESDIADILDEMENWAKLKTKRSAYLTANNWLKERQRKRDQAQQKPSYRPNVQKALDLVKKTKEEEEGSGIW